MTKDVKDKIRILVILFFDAWGVWKRDIYPVDLDAQYCCHGRECGCGGMTHRDSWLPNTEGRGI